jgi:DNA primase
VSKLFSAVNALTANSVMAAFLPAVELHRDGASRLKGLCPFHEEHTRSFTVYEHRYKCFGCGASGTNIDLLLKAGLAGTPLEAARLLAKRFGIAVEETARKQKKERRRSTSPAGGGTTRRTESDTAEGCTLVQYGKEIARRFSP